MPCLWLSVAQAVRHVAVAQTVLVGGGRGRCLTDGLQYSGQIKTRLSARLVQCDVMLVIPTNLKVVVG